MDHTEFTTENFKFGELHTGGINSKDMADALCRVVNAICEDGDEAFAPDPESGGGAMLDTMLDVYDSLARTRSLKAQILRADTYRKNGRGYFG